MEKLWVNESGVKAFILEVDLNGLINQFIALQKADQKRILKECGDVFEIDPTDLMYTFKDWLNSKVEEDISDILKYEDWESITGDIQEYADSISVKTQEQP